MRHEFLRLTVARRVRVEGRVQGVFFRDWTVEQASALGVCGWVRNRRDGSVEAQLEGPATVVDRLVERLHAGPPAARVDRVEVQEVVPQGVSGFARRPTADGVNQSG